MQDLTVPGSVTVDGDNTGATDSEGIGFNTVWEAFTITGAGVTIDYAAPRRPSGIRHRGRRLQLPTIMGNHHGACVRGRNDMTFIRCRLEPALSGAAVPIARRVRTPSPSAVACGGGNPPNDECAGATIQELSVPGSATVTSEHDRRHTDAEAGFGNGMGGLPHHHRDAPM